MTGFHHAPRGGDADRPRRRGDRRGAHPAQGRSASPSRAQACPRPADRRGCVSATKFARGSRLPTGGRPCSTRPAAFSSFQQELSRRHHRRDRPRGRDHRADPLPPLRLEARPLPRLPRRGLAPVSRVRRGGARDEPLGLPRGDRRCLYGQARQAQAGRPLDPGAHRGLRGRGDRQGAARADPGGARLLRGRRDPARPGRRASSTRDPRSGGREAWIFVAGGLLATDRPPGSAVCSAATSSGCAPPGAPG